MPKTASPARRDRRRARPIVAIAAASVAFLLAQAAPAFAGGEPLRQPSPGGEPLSQPSPGGEPLSQPSPGGEPLSQPSPGGEPLSQPNASSAWLATVIYRTVGRAAPSDDARAVMPISPVSGWGGPEQLLVVGSRTDADGSEWVKVVLDVRPNGTAVWLNANYVTLHLTHWRIVVSRAQRRLRVYLDGRLRRTWRVVVGKPSTPTPGGLFAIAAELRQPDPGDFVGSWVLPLTAHSNVLLHFEGGDGQIALHGRAGASLLDPLGSALSHGCVRMENDMVAWLASHVPIGTPVLVR